MDSLPVGKTAFPLAGDPIFDGMARPSRREAIIGGLALLSAGCIGPVAEQNDVEGGQPDDEEEEDMLTDEDLETIVMTVEDALDHFEHSAALLEEWKAEPASVPVEDIDQLRIDATALLARYWDNVLPFEEDLRNLGDEWAGSGQALADELSRHELLLREIEDASITIVNAEGEVARVPESGRETIDNVIETSPEVMEAAEAALPD